MSKSTPEIAKELVLAIEAREFGDVSPNSMIQAWREMKDELATTGDASNAFLLALRALAK